MILSSFVSSAVVNEAVVAAMIVCCASVKYLLLLLSAMSAVVASAQAVTSPFVSYVIFVLVAPVIAPLAVTLAFNRVSVSLSV